MPAGGFNAAGSRLGNWKRRLGDSAYEEQLERIFPFVESVGADGLYEVVEEFTV
jgi:hypothetical protein